MNEWIYYEIYDYVYVYIYNYLTMFKILYYKLILLYHLIE